MLGFWSNTQTFFENLSQGLHSRTRSSGNERALSFWSTERAAVYGLLALVLFTSMACERELPKAAGSGYPGAAVVKTSGSASRPASGIVGYWTADDSAKEVIQFNEAGQVFSYGCDARLRNEMETSWERTPTGVTLSIPGGSISMDMELNGNILENEKAGSMRKLPETDLSSALQAIGCRTDPVTKEKEALGDVRTMISAQATYYYKSGGSMPVR